MVTGLLFYLVFTPVAIVLRWLGKDHSGLTRDPAATTYWIRQIKQRVQHDKSVLRV